MDGSMVSEAKPSSWGAVAVREETQIMKKEMMTSSVPPRVFFVRFTYIVRITYHDVFLAGGGEKEGWGDYGAGVVSRECKLN